MAENLSEFTCVLKSSKSTLGAPLSRDGMEKRRLEALQDLLAGQTQSAVASKFGVSRTTTSRWNRALLQKGVESLRRRRATGRPCRLSGEQLLQIQEIFSRGALVYGFSDNRWTAARLAAAIELRFGVHYGPDHVGRLMHKVGLRGPRSNNTHRFAVASATSRGSHTSNSDLTLENIGRTI